MLLKRRAKVNPVSQNPNFNDFDLFEASRYLKSLARRSRLIGFGLYSVTLVSITYGVMVWTEHSLFQVARDEATARLELHASHIERVMDKFRMIPPLMIQDAYFTSLLEHPFSPAEQLKANNTLARVTAMSGAVEIRLLDASGTPIATSNALDGVSLDPAPKQHLDQAREGRLGRANMLGDTGKRYYLFASALKRAGRVLGMIDLRFNLEDIDQNWALSLNPVVAVDRNGAVVSSSETYLRNLLLTSVSDGPTFFDNTERFIPKQWRGLARLAWSEPLVVDREAQRTYIPVRRNIAVLDWTVFKLIDIEPLQRRSLGTGIAAALGFTVLAILLWATWERAMRTRLERLRGQDAAKRLESMVEERTAELKKAQYELVQAAKMAALGQMSAAISHEFNQPLGAIRMFSENAEQMMHAGKFDGAVKNMARIRNLVDRMAELSKTLKTFARKPGSEIRSVDVDTVVQDVMTVLSPRLKAKPVRISINRPDRPIHVQAGAVRLGQVIMNILSNALDATELQPDPLVSIEWQSIIGSDARPSQAILTIHDNGPGIAPQMMEQLFDPFMTSKEPGHGLGLGLSIAYNIIRDFNGEMTPYNHADGGAVFVVRLPMAISK